MQIAKISNDVECNEILNLIPKMMNIWKDDGSFVLRANLDDMKKLFPDVEFNFMMSALPEVAYAHFGRTAFNDIPLMLTASDWISGVYLLEVITDDEKVIPFGNTGTICLSPIEFEASMRKLTEEYSDDPEILHDRMDSLMMETLKMLGYGAGVEIFDDAPKWYA